MSKFVPIIGLEIHVELKTASKMFCSCKNEPDEAHPNKNVCEICLAHPGTLPVPNKKAIELAVLIARALNCKIAKTSKFDRKNYFYPDLPKGYQISQYDEPIGEKGSIDLVFSPDQNHRQNVKIGITRVHLEEDTAKLSHEKNGNTLVDFNRGGVPLVEIVSEPDIESASEAKTYCQELQLIFRYLGASDADMEKGHMRCEANVSIQEKGRFVNNNGIIEPIDNYELNNKVELKNINSFRHMERAVKYEIERQIDLIEKGEKWSQQTRGWDENHQETVWQRDKETSADYRYFPEPDIPPFSPRELSDNTHIIELPQEKRTRYISEYNFSEEDAKTLTSNKYWAEYTENVMSELYDWIKNIPEEEKNYDKVINKLNIQTEIARLASGWLTNKLMGLMAERKIDIRILKIKEENFAELISLIHCKKINSTNALKILTEMLESGSDKDPTHIMEEKGYGQVSDEGQIETIVDQVIVNHPAQVEQYRAGKETLLKFLIGMVMKASEGSADPSVAEKILINKLK